MSYSRSKRMVKNPDTKQNLEYHHAELSCSNASSNRGNITTAGFIFFKRPTFTHQFFFLKELCRKLTPAATFFDISLNRKTPTGKTVPHLIVKCGENSIRALTEILSSFLNGNDTTVFRGQLLLSKMEQKRLMQSSKHMQIS